MPSSYPKTVTLYLSSFFNRPSTLFNRQTRSHQSGEMTSLCGVPLLTNNWTTFFRSARKISFKEYKVSAHWNSN